MENKELELELKKVELELKKIEIEQKDQELELNAKLQQKKNALRKELAEQGLIKEDKVMEIKGRKVPILSIAGYKNLFTNLLSKHLLELNFEIPEIEILESDANVRLIKAVYYLIDAETGFSEETTIYAEGIDYSDKAIYKAYSGSLKYCLANKFTVATGDENECEDDNIESNIKKKKNVPNKKTKQKDNELINANNKKILLDTVPEEIIKSQLQLLKVKSIDKLTAGQARKIIKDYKEVVD